MAVSHDTADQVARILIEWAMEEAEVDKFDSVGALEKLIGRLKKVRGGKSYNMTIHKVELALQEYL